ncbi:MAG TPA: methyltransferase, FxLD system [Micromonosporaceae bacterium]|nr:methyltransferase, FxLD system [Micromonosporaceae bacterium]
MTDPTALRHDLVEEVLGRTAISDEQVTAALRAVPRHVFLPQVPPESVYRDEAIVTKRDPDGLPTSSSSQPSIMAIMLDQLGLAPGQRVLEVGAGTGYNAALMAHIVGPAGEVVTVDIDHDVVARARAGLAAAGFPGVRVVCADGSEGFPPRAPYHRMIATVGVWDLAPAWLDQLAPDGRLVVPLDLRGAQVSGAFERAPGGGHWVSRSVAACGFMRMRGAMAGPDLVRVLDREAGLALMTQQPDGLDAGGLRRALDAPPVELATGVAAEPMQLFDGVALWLAVHDPRCCGLSETRPAGPSAGQPAEPTRRGFAVFGAPGWRMTIGLLAGASLAALARGSDDDSVSVYGYGPAGDRLGADLVRLVRAWADAGRPMAKGLRIDAYRRLGGAAEAPDPNGRPVIEKRHTRLVLSWPASPGPSTSPRKSERGL